MLCSLRQRSNGGGARPRPQAASTSRRKGRDVDAQRAAARPGRSAELPIEQASVASTPHPGDHPDGAIEYAPPAPCKPDRHWQRPPPHRAGRPKNIEIYSPSIAPGGAGLRAERRLGEIMQQQAETVGKAKGATEKAARRGNRGV